MKKTHIIELLYFVVTIFLFIMLVSENGQAQERIKKPGIFIGAGVGFGNVKKIWNGGPSDSGMNVHGHIGFGLKKWVFLMLEYEVHHLNDEKPEISDFAPGEDYSIQIREPKIFKSTFILTSVQFNLAKGFYIRPCFGLGFRYNAVYSFSGRSNEPPTSAHVSRGDVNLAYGVSAGYEYLLSQQFGLGLNAVFRRTIATSARRALGIQIIGTWYF